MSLREQLRHDLQDAMRQRDTLRVSTIRLLNAAIKNREIAQGGELDDEEILGSILGAVKQRREAIVQAQQYGREDIVKLEQQEMAILESYLPRQLSREEIAQHVATVVRELEATSMKDMGRIMQALMSRLKGQADGQTVSQLVRDRLSVPSHASSC